MDLNLELLRAVVALVAVGAGWFAETGATATPRTALSRTTSAALRRRAELDMWSKDPSLGVRARTEASVHVSDAGPEVAKVTLYVPAGYGLDPTARPGTTEGHVYLLTGSDIGVGELTAVDPASYDDTPETQACAPGGHAGVWVMPLDFLIDSAQTAVPVYVDPTSGAETALGAVKLQTCLPLAVVPSPGGWPIGSRLRDLTFEFSRLTDPHVAAVYTWRAFVSEPDPSGDPDLSTSYELRSDVPLPVKLTLSGRFESRQGRAVLGGRLTTQTSATADGLRVALFRVGPHRSLRHVATARTSPNGSYRFVRLIPKTAAYATEVSGIGSCTVNSTTAPGGCVDETRGTVESPDTRIVVRVDQNRSPSGNGVRRPRDREGRS